MTGAGRCDATISAVDINQLRGDEHVDAGKLFEKQTVNTRQESSRLVHPFRNRAQQAAENRGEHRGRNSFAHDVGNDEQQRIVIDFYDVVKISADLMSAFAETGKAVAGKPRN